MPGGRLGSERFKRCPRFRSGSALFRGRAATCASKLFVTAIDDTAAYATGINDLGQITGITSQTGVSHVYRWDNPRTNLVNPSSLPWFYDLGGLPGYPAGGGLGINATGQSYGTFSITDFPYYHRSFFVSDGVLRDIGTLGGNENYAHGMNDAGYVVGTTQAATGGSRAYVWHDGDFTDLGTYGPFASVAYGINNLGQVVGTGGPNGNPFLWQDGVITDLTTLIDSHAGWRGLNPTAINDAGQIVGQGVNPHGDYHAFLLTPDERSLIQGRTYAVGGIALLPGASARLGSAIPQPTPVELGRPALAPSAGASTNGATPQDAGNRNGNLSWVSDVDSTTDAAFSALDPRRPDSLFGSDSDPLAGALE